jgi:superfamily II DNA helicase RecQ
LLCMQFVRTRSTGKLYAELFPGNEISRDNFEEVLGAMARAELLTFADAVFEKQGKQIPYRTVSLTPTGRNVDETMPLLFVMKDAGRPVPKRKRKKNSSKSKGSPRATARAQSRQADTGAAGSERQPQIRIEQALRAWRLSEAKHRKIPAFRVFGDRALRSIATICPQNDAELLAVPGIGMSIVKKYGAHIYRLVAGSS